MTTSANTLSCLGLVKSVAVTALLMLSGRADAANGSLRGISAGELRADCPMPTALPYELLNCSTSKKGIVSCGGYDPRLMTLSGVNGQELNGNYWLYKASMRPAESGSEKELLDAYYINGKASSAAKLTTNSYVEPAFPENWRKDDSDCISNCEDVNPYNCAFLTSYKSSNPSSEMAVAL